MFVYLLIASELALLYTVFWYLYLREPKVNRRISGELWGSYEGDSRQPFVEPTYQPATTYHPEIPQPAYQHGQEPRYYVLDQVTNHYVPIEEGIGLLDRMALTVDNALSRLNVKP